MRSILVIQFVVIAQCLCRVVGASQLNVSVVAIGYTSPIGLSSLVYLGPAMRLGAQYVRDKYADTMNITLTFLEDPPPNSCPELGNDAVNLVADWHYRHRRDSDLTIYLNNACVENSEIPFFMSQWNALWISTQSASPQISNRRANPTWIAVNHFSTSQCAQFYVELFKRFRWSTIFILLDTGSPPIYAILANNLLAELKKDRDIVFVTYFRTITTTPGRAFGQFAATLDDIRKLARVVLFFGHAAFLREFLITAAGRNMTNGEYVYMAQENMRNFKILGKLHWQYNDENDPVAFQAFQSLLVVQQRDIDLGPDPHLGAQFVNVSRTVYNFAYELQDQPFMAIVDSYLAFTALASVLNDSITDGKVADLWNGRALARRFLNRTFIDQYKTFFVDDTGQRRTDLVVAYFSSLGTRERLIEKTGVERSWIVYRNLSNWANSSLLFPPFNEPVCGYSYQKLACQPPKFQDAQLTYIVTFTVVGVVVLLAICISIYLAYMKRKAAEQLLLDPWWHLTLTNLNVSSQMHSPVSSFFVAERDHPVDQNVHDTNSHIIQPDGNAQLAMHEGKPVICFPVHQRTTNTVTFADLSTNRPLLVLLKEFHKLEHTNMCRLYGLSIARKDLDFFEISAVFERPARGNLPALSSSFVSKDFTFITSLIMDFLEAVQVVHGSSFGYHGRLSVFNCWVDKHFTLKLIHLGSDRIAADLGQDNEEDGQCSLPALAVAWEEFFWLAPECRVTSGRSAPIKADVQSMQALDIFSSGFIIYDILTRSSLCTRMQNSGRDAADNAWSKEQQINADVTSSIHKINSTFDNPLLNAVDLLEIPSGMAGAIGSCWTSEPAARPTIQQLRARLAAVCPLLAPSARRYKLFDKVQQRLLIYSAKLEHEVELRSRALEEEMLKCDALISQILPKTIVTRLRAGLPVDPELFESVTLVFSDIYGFTEFVGSQPPEVSITFISKAEDVYDGLCAQCDVYKVEAIGDSFLAASGLPKRIGSEHIRCVAVFALKMMEAEAAMELSDGMRLKIGIHSGTCAAGVMGTKRPRYCLFGDTINMASRMCSHGTPGKVHMSSDAKQLLDRFVEFRTEERGLLAVKGKNSQMTYWLMPNTELPLSF